MLPTTYYLLPTTHLSVLLVCHPNVTHSLHELPVLLGIVHVRDTRAAAAVEEALLLGVCIGEQASTEEDVVEDMVITLACKVGVRVRRFKGM